MINVGQIVYYLLSGNTQLTNYVGDRIYPLVIPENTISPVIVYERRSSPEFNKDAIGLYVAVIDISVITENYKEGIDIALIIDSILNGYSNTVLDTRIRSIKFENVDEGYSDGLFIQKIGYSIKTN